MIPNTISVGERITLSHCQTEKFKAGMLSLSLVLPIDPQTTYLNSLLLSVLLRGTKRYPNVSAINRRLDYLYGTELSVRNFYRGDVQVIGLAASLLDAAYLPAGEGKTLLAHVLEVMRELLFCPLTGDDGCLKPHYVESEKKLQCDTIRAQKNHPHAYAADRARALMYSGEPCGTPIWGTEAQVERVTPEQLTEHWKALLSAMSIRLFYVGSESFETVINAVRDTLLPLMPHSRLTELPSALSCPHAAKSEPIRAEEEHACNQGHLVIGLHTGCRLSDADFYTCTLLNEILGASPVSKLFMNVREKRSLCYSCSSLYNGYKGTLLISCGLSAQNRALAEEEIAAQLRSIAKGEISDDEWAAAQKSLANAYRQLEDNPTAIESYYFGRGLAGVKDSIEACRARLTEVSREDVISLASRLTLDTVFFLRETGGGEEESDEED